MNLKCPKCGSTDYHKKGLTKKNGNQRYKCKKCKSRFTDNTGTQHNAKILLFDIETTPMETYVWQLKNNNYIHIHQIIEDWNIICWRAKWLFDDTIHGDVQTPHEAIRRDDKRVSKSLWKMIDESDIILAHNLRNFDLKKANTRFLMHGLRPTSPCQMIDTLLEARKTFKFSSNKLDYLCKMLGIDTKLDTGFQLWKDCLGGKRISVESKHHNNQIMRVEIFDAKVVAKALDEMYVYCGQDTAILEDLYLKLRPYIKSHPNLGLYMESGNRENICANCGSKDIMYESKPYYTPTGQYQTFRCQDCGALIRSRYSEKREKELLRSCAR